MNCFDAFKNPVPCPVVAMIETNEGVVILLVTLFLLYLIWRSKSKEP